MSNEIIKVMDALCEKFGIAIDWTSDNVMPYLQQLMERFIRYEISTSIFTIAFLAIITAICAMTALIAYKKGKTREYFDPDEVIWWVAVVGSACAVFCGVLFVICAGIYGSNIITCISFPEKKIIEYISSLKIL